MPAEASPPQGRVAGKVAFVTGAASGIGRAGALLLAEQGAAVCCADLNLAGAEETASLAGRGASACRLDVTLEPSWENALAETVRRHGQLDVVVNCAGIASGSPLTETPLEEWRRVMAVNLEGVFLGTKHAIRVMRQHSRAGSIVNVSSLSGNRAQPGAAAYCASKAAVLMLSRTAALECLRDGGRIRVNTVSPGGVRTPMWSAQPFFQELIAKEGSEEKAFEAMERMSPNGGRWALPEEVAQGILYLASDESLCVNGTDLAVDNGGSA